MGSTGPCKYCAEYPYQCRGICKDKMQYINECIEETPVVKEEKYKPKRIFDNSISKNGIRREISGYKRNRKVKI